MKQHPMTHMHGLSRAMAGIRRGILVALALMLLAPSAAHAEVDEGYLWPVPASRIVAQRFTPRSHEAIDIAGKLGDDVVAAKAGKVVYVFTGCVNEDGLATGIRCKRAGCPKKSRQNHPYDGFCNYGLGNGVVLRHDDGSFTAYGHFSALDPAMKRNARVEQGQVLGKIGTSGRSSGTHLHFSVTKARSARFDVNRVDPSKVFAPYVIVGDCKSSDVTECTARLEGEFSYLGAKPLVVGVCLGTSQADLRPSSGYLDTEFPDLSYMKMYYNVDNIEGMPLQPNTTYYWRCYANANGAIVYGDIQSFTTKKDGATRILP